MALYRVRTTFAGGMTGPGLHLAHWVSSVDSDANAQLCVDHMRDFWTTLQPRMFTAVGWTVQGIVQVIEALTGNLINERSVISRTATGTAVGDPLPPANQGLVNLRSTLFVNGRRVRGHWNIPGTMEADSTNGIPTLTYTNALQTASNTLTAFADPFLVVYSRRNGTTGGALSASVPAKWAVLRSRRD
jgi:hypothetical protein